MHDSDSTLQSQDGPAPILISSRGEFRDEPVELMQSIAKGDVEFREAIWSRDEERAKLTPSKSPLPVRADAPNICQSPRIEPSKRQISGRRVPQTDIVNSRSLRLVKLRPVDTSDGVMAFGRSCLLAYTKSSAVLRFYIRESE